MVDSIRRIARAENGRAAWPALGLVTSVHTGSEAAPELSCTVRLRESGVVLPHVPIAVGTLGFAAPPSEGDLVLVLFAGGDLHAPAIAGCVYDERVAAPVSEPGQVVAWLPRSEPDETKRLEIIMRTADERSVALRLAGDVEVLVTVQEEKVELVVGRATITLTASSGDDATAEIKAGDAVVRIEQAGDVTVEAAGKLTLKGETVEIAGSSEVKVTGQTIKLN
ncbi:phage baseplate assembly protein V [Actinomadura sp. HBU206391]|uniref:phage baseplate assembly protein V n=1 Tax=Actinomadura sp. HBU206391 TaxID=2731692 RepID=UPI0021C807E1|nr:phage baseplate assembly protein V [Actinomadura sp. HBU206391]